MSKRLPILTALALAAIASAASAISPAHFARLLWAGEIGAAPTAWSCHLTTATNNALATIFVVGGGPVNIAWGDGNSTSVSGTATRTNQYATAGSYVVTMAGTATTIQFGTTWATRDVWKSFGPVAGTSFGYWDNTFADNRMATNYAEPFFAGANPSAITNIFNSWLNNASLRTAPRIDALTNLLSIKQAWSKCTNLFDVPAISNLTKLTDISFAWADSTRITNLPMDISMLTNVTTVEASWRSLPITNAPEVNVLTKITSLGTLNAGAWRGCSKLRSPPAVSNLTNVTTAAYAWSQCTAMTNAPNISALVRVTTIAKAFEESTNTFAIPLMPSSNTNLNDITELFDGCIRMTGAAPIWWNSTGGVDTANFPALTLAKCANAYRGCTNLSNYGMIPTNWGGTNNTFPLW